MSLRIKFASLSGKFTTAHEQVFATYADALAAVKAYAESGGYTNVRAVDDADSVRFTARTPGGRGGRNVAFADYDYEV
jgi:hypothetical protein